MSAQLTPHAPSYAGTATDHLPPAQVPASKPTGRFDRETLATLIKQSGGPQELADRPHDYAMAILQQGGSV
jgi:hypothetical protein